MKLDQDNKELKDKYDKLKEQFDGAMRNMTDTARLHKVTLQNGDIQQFIYKWDEVLSLMRKRPDDDDLMNLFVLQFDVHLPQKS